MTDEELRDMVLEVSDRVERVDRLVWLKRDGREKPEDKEECLRILAEAQELVKKLYGSGVSSD